MLIKGTTGIFVGYIHWKQRRAVTTLQHFSNRSVFCYSWVCLFTKITLRKLLLHCIMLILNGTKTLPCPSYYTAPIEPPACQSWFVSWQLLPWFVHFAPLTRHTSLSPCHTLPRSHGVGTAIWNFSERRGIARKYYKIWRIISHFP